MHRRSLFFKKAAQRLRLSSGKAQGAQLGCQCLLERGFVHDPVLVYHGADGAVIGHQQQAGLIEPRQSDRFGIYGNQS